MKVQVEERILIGERTLRGRGSGGNRSLVQDAAEESQEEIVRRLRRFEVVFLLAGLGGGTGSALLPYFTSRLRATSTLVDPVAFLPFHLELETNPERRENVLGALDELEDLSGLLMVLANEKLRRFEALPLPRVFHLRNTYLHNLVASLLDMIENPSQLNVDLASLKGHLRDSGLSTLLCGEYHISEPEKVVQQALTETLMDFHLTGAPTALIHLDGGSNFTLRTLDRILRSLRQRLGEPRRLLFGTRVHAEPKEVIRLDRGRRGTAAPERAGLARAPVDQGSRPSLPARALRSGDGSFGLPQIELVVHHVDALGTSERTRAHGKAGDPARPDRRGLGLGQIAVVADHRGEPAAIPEVRPDRAPGLVQPEGAGDPEEPLELGRRVRGGDQEPRRGLDLAVHGERTDQGVLEQRGRGPFVGVEVSEPVPEEADAAGRRRGLRGEEDRQLDVAPQVVRERERRGDDPGDLVHPAGPSGQVVQRKVPGDRDPVGEDEEPTHRASEPDQKKRLGLASGTRSVYDGPSRRGARGARAGASVWAGAVRRSSQISSPSS